ncbi:hypothetical protein TELCIR_01493 [Teladorsagia circumcincta]|uniref:Uncharacterized protein n=1 Tax=Teladorsagia circumcincta TaxID=45464 RepID=A0A2G9V1Q1_TELCI|nr:hypothetical protein TELCIR_01493 [Teladorsagia circumcincta]
MANTWPRYQSHFCHIITNPSSQMAEKTPKRRLAAAAKNRDPFMFRFLTNPSPPHKLLEDLIFAFVIE